MRVLVAGAAGFLGLAAVAALSRGGHEVVGLVRSPAKAAHVEAAGGTPAVGDVLNASALAQAAAGCDALIHLAHTRDAGSPALGQSMAAKVRVDGAYNLVAAARAVKARRLVIGSGYWEFGHHEGTITEETPLNPIGTSVFNYQAERAGLEANRPGDLEVVVARPGMVYGDGGWFKEMVGAIRGGTYRVPGDGANHWSPVHVDDVGEGFRLLLEEGGAGQAYLIVDDEPLPLKEFAGLIAETLGVDPPVHESMEDTKARIGETRAKMLTANQRASNAKLRGVGWAPRWRSSREGVPAVVRAMGP
ncbi:MAG TPA: NAD-dependent epimerase/dehydratase family protein [Candidatus Thermoplasmatota archaeon]